MTALTTITAIAAIGGLVLGAVSAVSQGQAAAKQAKFQSEVARRQAERERQIAAAQEEDFRRRQSRALASRRARLGASGVEPGEGSPLLVSEDFAGEVELQALRIRNGGEALVQQAALHDAAGRNARTQGYLRAGSLLLDAAGTGFEAFGEPKETTRTPRI
jgi:hypothetical protein